MAHIRTSLALAVLLSAAAPLAAQPGRTHVFDAGSFVMELPHDIPELTVFTEDRPTLSAEFLVGGDYERGVVMVHRSRPRGLPQHPAAGDMGTLMRFMEDTTQAHRNTFLKAPVDTSAAGREAVRRFLEDTTLVSRRAYARLQRELLSQISVMIRPDSTAAAREIVTDDRVAIRIPVRLPGEPLLYGIADLSVPRRGPPDTWLVVRAAVRRTPALDAEAARLLDSFRITGRPTTARVGPPGERRD